MQYMNAVLTCWLHGPAPLFCIFQKLSANMAMAWVSNVTVIWADHSILQSSMPYRTSLWAPKCFRAPLPPCHSLNYYTLHSSFSLGLNKLAESETESESLQLEFRLDVTEILTAFSGSL